MTLAHPTGARVLVVDDDPLLVRLVRTHLEKAGYRVIDARDGEHLCSTRANELQRGRQPLAAAGQDHDRVGVSGRMAGPGRPEEEHDREDEPRRGEQGEPNQQAA